MLAMSGDASGGGLDLSVLLSTRDRARLLRATLERFAALDMGGASWELIAIDNGSRDETRAVLEAARARLPLTVLEEPRPGKNRALNQALPLARGGLLVFTDDDVEPVPRWLAELLAASRRFPGHDIFAGPVTPRFPPGTPAWLAEHPFCEGAFARYRPAEREGPVEVLPFGPNFAVRARRMAGFAYCEDIGSQGSEGDLLGSEMELLERLRAAGAGIVFVPAAGVGHVVLEHQIALPWLFRRSFRLGRTHARLRREGRLFAGPLGLSLRLSNAWVRHALSRFRGEQARFESGIRLYGIRGLLYEALARGGRAPRLARLVRP
jgi:hypothetical protein